MAIDPVCGMEVDEKEAAATSEYKGKTYYFCAFGCKKAFDENPEEVSGELWRPLEELLIQHRAGQEEWIAPSYRLSHSSSSFSRFFLRFNLKRSQ